MKTNVCILGDCIKEMTAMPDNSVDLVIADPPYWKVVGQKWDYMWRTEEDYVKWSLSWIKEVSRVLRIGGTFYCFGYFRTLALLVPHLDDFGLELRQQIIIDKGMRAVSGRATRKYKMFPNTTESILFMIKDNKKFVKDFLKRRQKALGLTAKQINEYLGVKSNGGGMWSIYTGNNVCEQFPTEELWNKLSELLQYNCPYAPNIQPPDRHNRRMARHRLLSGEALSPHTETAQADNTPHPRKQQSGRHRARPVLRVRLDATFMYSDRQKIHRHRDKRGLSQYGS